MTLLLSSLLACQDYNLDFGGDKPGFEDDPSDTSADTDTETTPGEEMCNGLDDDGDGSVDEGYPDSDGDGRADCLEEACPDLSVGVAGAATIRAECEGRSYSPADPVEDPWATRDEWVFDASGSYTSLITPLVANLTDDNGDGRVDGDDTPEVVMVGASGLLYVLDGVGGRLQWEKQSDAFATPAVGDIDADGSPDIVYQLIAGGVDALEADGAAKWSTRGLVPGMYAYDVQIVDLQGDGRPEVVAGDLVLDGASGTLLFQLALLPPTPTLESVVVADVDLDGDQEIFAHGGLFDSDGTPIWDLGSVAAMSSYPLSVQADADDEAEIALVDSFGLHVLDTDGTLLAESTISVDDGSGLPCAADFDGDGEMEVGVPFYYEGGFSMFDLDGTERWNQPVDYRTYGAGCSGFDLDGDGALEVIYAADEAFYVYDGDTGAVRVALTDKRTVTFWEYAVVADIDHDDHAEILFTSDDPVGLVTSLGHDGDGWPAAGPMWSEEAFRQTNIAADASIPREPEPSWLGPQVYRARTAVDGSMGFPDLQVDITDLCVTSCEDGVVQVALQVSNAGARRVPPGVAISFYAEEATGPRWAHSERLPELPAGQRLAGVVVSLPLDALGSQGLQVTIDDDGSGSGGVGECDETNNRSTWRDGLCP